MTHAAVDLNTSGVVAQRALVDLSQLLASHFASVRADALIQPLLEAQRTYRKLIGRVDRTRMTQSRHSDPGQSAFTRAHRRLSEEPALGGRRY
jgi:hypothetical protein